MTESCHGDGKARMKMLALLREMFKQMGPVARKTGWRGRVQFLGLLFLIFLCVCMNVCLCTMCIPGALRGQKEGIRLPETGVRICKPPGANAVNH